MIYCGEYFGIVTDGHDGNCGPDNGHPCSACLKLISVE